MLCLRGRSLVTQVRCLCYSPKGKQNLIACCFWAELIKVMIFVRSYSTEAKADGRKKKKCYLAGPGQLQLQ